MQHRPIPCHLHPDLKTLQATNNLYVHIECSHFGWYWGIPTQCSVRAIHTSPLHHCLFIFPCHVPTQPKQWYQYYMHHQLSGFESFWNTGPSEGTSAERTAASWLDAGFLTPLLLSLHPCLGIQLHPDFSLKTTHKKVSSSRS